MSSKRTIFDTNLWISFLISKKYNQIDDLINSRKILLIFSSELLEEFITVARRPKFEKYFSKTDIDEILRLLEFHGKLVEINSKTSVCRDSKDNFLLNLALDSQADYLLTGDEDLLVLKNIKRTRICTWGDFIDDLGK